MYVYTVKHNTPHECHATVFAGTDQADAMRYADVYVHTRDNCCRQAQVLRWYNGGREAAIIETVDRDENRCPDD